METPNTDTPPGHQWCRNCLQTLPNTDFAPSRLLTGNYICRQCNADISRRRREACREITQPLRQGPCPICDTDVGVAGMEWCFDKNTPDDIRRPLTATIKGGSLKQVREAVKWGRFMCRPCRLKQTKENEK